MKRFSKIISLILAVTIILGVVPFAFADSVYVTEAEPNDTYANATVVTEGSGATGKLTAEGTDVDWYKFTVSKTGIAIITFTGAGTGANENYYKVSLYTEANAAEGNALYTYTIKGNETAKDSAGSDVSTGTYYIKVETASASSVDDYKINLTVEEKTLTEKEENNTAATANDISDNPKQYYYGIVSTATDVDYYRFSMKQGYFYYYIRSTGNEEGTIKAQAIVLNSSSEEVVIGEISCTATSGQAGSAEIGMGLSQVYIKVSGDVSGYELKYYTKESSIFETEPNGAKETADDYTCGSQVVGSISAASDVDIYKSFTTSDDKDYKLTVSAYSKSATSTWTVNLYNKDFTVVDTKSVTGSSAAEFELDKYDVGVFYVEVIAGTTYGVDKYILSSVQYTPEEDEDEGSLWDKIKALNWGSFIKDSGIGELVNNISDFDNITMLFYTLFKLSFGSIFKFLNS